jgi:nicotinamide mononucleotide adenylyltransferase
VRNVFIAILYINMKNSHTDLVLFRLEAIEKRLEQIEKSISMIVQSCFDILKSNIVVHNANAIVPAVDHVPDVDHIDHVIVSMSDRRRSTFL